MTALRTAKETIEKPSNELHPIIVLLRCAIDRPRPYTPFFCKWLPTLKLWILKVTEELLSIFSSHTMTEFDLY